MQHVEDRITVTTDVHLHVEHWAPDERSRGLIVIAHGIAEHISRYRHVAERFVEHGWSVVGPDHRGHGRSSGELGMLPDLEVAAADLDQVVTWADPGSAPVVMLGHSMGSLIALTAVLRRPDAYSSLVLSGTALAAGDDTGGATKAVLKGLARVMPTARLVPPLDSNQICSDAAVVQAYTEDPLVDHGRPRLATGLAMLRAIDEIKAKAGSITLPTLLVHGVDDGLTPISGAEWLVDGIGSEVVELKRYAGRHEVMNEPIWSEVVDDIDAWLR
ncbi:MAG: lysophospholipase [Actinomycetota bacterium]